MVLYETTKETVEAELEAVVHAQRVREGESRVERQFIKWTAEGTGKDIFGYQVFCDVRAYVSCREYEGIPPSARVRP